MGDREEKLVLGVKVSGKTKTRVLETINAKCELPIENSPKYRPYWPVTAYSETFLEALENNGYLQTILKADEILADGAGVWLAMGRWETDRPMGVQIARELLESRKYKIFLLGGFGGVSRRLAEKYGCGWEEEGPNEDPKIVTKINRHKPDVLLVSYGRVRQEKWIAQNIDKLKCKCVIGVGSAFDEIAGEGIWKGGVPDWVDKFGLKTIWRTLKDPKHIYRLWRAWVVFPWKVLLSKI